MRKIWWIMLVVLLLVVRPAQAAGQRYIEQTCSRSAGAVGIVLYESAGWNSKRLAVLLPGQMVLAPEVSAAFEWQFVIARITDSLYRAGYVNVSQCTLVNPDVPIAVAWQELTPTQESAPVPVTETPTDTSSAVTMTARDWLLLVAMAAIIILAVSNRNLIPPKTVDDLLFRVFNYAKEATKATPTPIDDKFVETLQQIIRQMVQTELAKRDAGDQYG